MRPCSARIRSETSRADPGKVPYSTPVTVSAAAISGRQMSMSQVDAASWRTARLRSSPAPVSTLGAGSGTSSPSGLASNCMNTRFQIST